MEARIITDRHQWNDFVKTSPYGNITQSYEWGELSCYLGSPPLYMGVIDDSGQLCAAMAALLISLPRVPAKFLYAPRGPILEDPNSQAMTVLLDFAREQAKKHNAFMLKIEPGAENTQNDWSQALQQRGFHSTEHTLHLQNEWILDISPDKEQIQANMKAQWRRNIRLAVRNGVNIRQGKGEADIHSFYQLMQQTSERKQFFAHNEAYFERFLELFGTRDMAVLLLAEREGQTVGGAIMMCLGDWAWYRFGASSAEHSNLRASYLLQWEGILWAKSHGCQHYNFLGIPTDLSDEHDPMQGVYFFKQGFGGYARCSLEGYELVYKPLIYSIYQHARDWRHKLKRA